MDVEVLHEDQQAINRFSRLNQKKHDLEQDVQQLKVSPGACLSFLCGARVAVRHLPVILFVS